MPVSTEANTLTIPGFQTPPSDPPADLMEAAPEPPTMSCLVFDAQTLQARVPKALAAQWSLKEEFASEFEDALKHAALCLGEEALEAPLGMKEECKKTSGGQTWTTR